MQRNDKITWKKCDKCGYLQHKSHLRCLNCKHDVFSYIEASGECILISYTILKAPPLEFRDKTSYALGIVEFENKIKALGQITTQENLKTGIKLKPVYTRLSKDLNDKEVFDIVFEPI